MKDVSGLNGMLGDGEGEWPRVGEVAPDPVPEWPLVDTADRGPQDPRWVKL
jgi:hypothetical protein